MGSYQEDSIGLTSNLHGYLQQVVGWDKYIIGHTTAPKRVSITSIIGTIQSRWRSNGDRRGSIWEDDFGGGVVDVVYGFEFWICVDVG